MSSNIYILVYRFVSNDNLIIILNICKIYFAVAEILYLSFLSITNSTKLWITQFKEQNETSGGKKRHKKTLKNTSADSDKYFTKILDSMNQLEKFLGLTGYTVFQPCTVVSGKREIPDIVMPVVPLWNM